MLNEEEKPLSPEVIAILNDLPPHELAALKLKLEKNCSKSERKNKTTTQVITVSHHYHCELCDNIKIVDREVKVSASDVGMRIHRKPLKLYTICQDCTKKFVIGLAVAGMMVEREKSNERR